MASLQLQNKHFYISEIPTNVWNQDEIILQTIKQIKLQKKLVEREEREENVFCLQNKPLSMRHLSEYDTNFPIIFF